MATDGLRPGTKVRKRGDNGTVGAVVHDSLFDLCGKGYVLVEFDENPRGSAVAIKQEELIVLEIITPEANQRECRTCIFFNGHCLRYTAGRIPMLLSGGDGKRIPTRIYPYCKQK